MDEERRKIALKRVQMIKLLHSVSAMRKAQKAYFQMKMKSDLQRSKMLEQEVDKQIQIIESEDKDEQKSTTESPMPQSPPPHPRG